MGNRCCPTSVKILDCIHQLQDVETTLQQLIHRYEVQILGEKKKILTKIRDKSSCIVHLRKIHIIKHHKKNLESRLTSCMQKRYHLESLNVTKMQINAIKTTTSAFHSFLKQHDIKKVEELQDNIEDMIEQACEINEVLSREETFTDLDETELEEEYQQLISNPIDLVLPEVPNQPIQTSEEENPEIPLLNKEMQMIPVCQ